MPAAEPKRLELLPSRGTGPVLVTPYWTAVRAREEDAVARGVDAGQGRGAVARLEQVADPAAPARGRAFGVGGLPEALLVVVAEQLGRQRHALVGVIGLAGRLDQSADVEHHRQPAGVEHGDERREIGRQAHIGGRRAAQCWDRGRSAPARRGCGRWCRAGRHRGRSSAGRRASPYWHNRCRRTGRCRPGPYSRSRSPPPPRRSRRGSSRRARRRRPGRRRRRASGRRGGTGPCSSPLPSFLHQIFGRGQGQQHRGIDPVERGIGRADRDRVDGGADARLGRRAQLGAEQYVDLVERGPCCCRRARPCRHNWPGNRRRRPRPERPCN